MRRLFNLYLTEEERREIEELKRLAGLRTDADAVRHAIKIALRFYRAAKAEAQ